MDEFLVFLIGIFAGVCLLGFSLILFDGSYDDGYKTGQIDTINGIIKYELVTQEDKTTTWERIEE